MMAPEIIYQDDDLLVLSKPAGQIVNTATSHHQESLQDYFAQLWHLPPPPLQPTSQDSSIQEIFTERRGMVHRLDKNTSGLLLWAKNPPALTKLLAQFKQRQVTKTYLCLTHGLLKQTSDRISLPLARKRTNRQIMAVDPQGRPAITHYQVQQYYQFSPDKLPQIKKSVIAKLYQGFSLLQVHLETGRTHQIRAHLTHLHHPLVGDQAYLSTTKAKLDPLWCPRQFLHAHRLTFTHPTTNKQLTFTADLPTDLTQALTYLIPA